MRKISSVKAYMTKSHTETFIHAFISSCLDYCNVLYVGLPKKLLYKLQKLQNAAIRLIFNVRSRHPVSSFFAELHWLNIEQRIIFKALLLIYKAVYGLAPMVLQNLVALRNRETLTIQTVFFNCSKFGKRALMYYMPRYWNNIPIDIRSKNDVVSFKAALKSYLLLNFAEFKNNMNY